MPPPFLQAGGAFGAKLSAVAELIGLRVNPIHAMLHRVRVQD